MAGIGYNRDVRPILSATCFHCHGPDKEGRKGDLRLDVSQLAFAERDKGRFAIVPGDLKQSDAWRRIMSDDPDTRMPPPDSQLSLTTADIEILRQWITQGAVYETHWAFIPPAASSPPKVKDQAWCNNEIDPFILAKLEAMGLTPSVKADRRTLIRRLSYDLTGLPPAIQEVHQFVNDIHANAYEALVDRLLASDHYGERMALAWLDQARYADTHGYSRDGGRDMWIWRDWVIQAYNEDMPFDQFLKEQIAGDLLPDATESQIIATGFSRNHMITAEGGTIAAENLTNYCVDRVKTTGEVFLGLTMACAQCHDHKFDPITQKDYYRFYAYFNTLGDKGNDGANGNTAVPRIKAKSPLKHHDIDSVRKQIAALEKRLQQPYPQMQQTWEQDTRSQLALRGKQFKTWPLKPLTVNMPNTRPDMITITPDGALRTKGKSNFYNIAFAVPDSLHEKITGIRIVFYPHPEVKKGSLGHGKDGAFGVTAVTVSADQLPVIDVDLNHQVALKTATASYAHPDHPPTHVLDPRRFDCWSPKGKVKTTQHLTLQFEKPLDPKASPYITMMINFQKIGTPGHFKCFAISGHDEDTLVPEEIIDILHRPPSQRTAPQRAQLASYHADDNPHLAPLRIKLTAMKRRLREMTEPYYVQVMNTSPQPRKTFILARGDYQNPLEEVTPGVPAFLPPLPDNAPSDRLALADWFISSDHPLTSRVAVNRLWQLCFGNGLVASSADFGTQGEWPSHKQLLDNLSVTFIQSGWRVKAMMKKIVMSAAYQQASIVNHQARMIDPENRMLAYGPRFRLQGEFIRDGALKVSGLLNPWIGGASVKPYQPSGLWRELSHYGSVSDTTQAFVPDQGMNVYRRSMYTLWKRTVPPPSMLAFDAPNREICTMKRASTNTPLQALVLLNDPQFVEAARVLAQNLMVDMPNASRQRRLSVAFESVTSRLPGPEEMDTLLAACREQVQYYERSPAEAEKLLSIGSSVKQPDLDLTEHAALMCTVQLIMNLSEAITKG